MDPKAGSFIPTRESLLSRIKDWGDEGSWTEFFQTYRDMIFRTAIKSGLTEQESEEVVQETLVSVAKTIKEFVYDPKKCRFKNWLGHLARKRIADCFRRRRREAHSGFPAAVRRLLRIDAAPRLASWAVAGGSGPR